MIWRPISSFLGLRPPHVELSRLSCPGQWHHQSRAWAGRARQGVQDSRMYVDWRLVSPAEGTVPGATPKPLTAPSSNYFPPFLYTMPACG